ncbi:unnamed protein product [Moneuplotes crassus]|uniref:Uncharacterized protein n=1 Tax=Euplotes crassus TaxID=5936 RepID=A0AAD1Y874_EUPCR|nr:unnamed protein product [Moneuplotes crassus]
MEIREMINAQNGMQNESEDEIQREKNPIHQSNIQKFNQLCKKRVLLIKKKPNNQVAKQEHLTIIKTNYSKKPEDNTPRNSPQHPQVFPNQAQQSSIIQEREERDKTFQYLILEFIKFIRFISLGPPM